MRPAAVVANEGGLARVSDGAGFDPAPMPQGSMSAGNWRLDAPVDVGTAGYVFAPGGDPASAFFLPISPSSASPAGSVEPGKLAMSGPGGETLTIEGGAITADMPASVTVTSPSVVVNSPDVHLGSPGGPRVARIGDTVVCPAGVGKITTGAVNVSAT